MNETRSVASTVTVRRERDTPGDDGPPSGVVSRTPGPEDPGPVSRLHGPTRFSGRRGPSWSDSGTLGDGTEVRG